MDLANHAVYNQKVVRILHTVVRGRFPRHSAPRSHAFHVLHFGGFTGEESDCSILQDFPSHIQVLLPHAQHKRPRRVLHSTQPIREDDAGRRVRG